MPKHKIIRSMMNGSKGPLLRKATSMDWVGEPFDMSGFDALHGERNFDEFLAHYQEYHDVVGDHALNLVATTLPANAYFATGDQKYKRWVTEYADAWLARMKQNNGIIPTFVDLDGKIGGPSGKWWGSAYGWGFSPVNPVTNRRENRNRIERPIIGFNNALLLTGDQKYVDAWRDMTNAVNANARTVDGKTQYPSMYGVDLTANPRGGKPGWYGWRDRPWNVGALEVWYFSQKPEDLARVPANPWLEYLQGRNPGYPETAMAEDLATIKQRVEGIRKDQSKPDKRLADNMLDLNPVTTTALIQLTQGGMEPDRRGNLVNSRLRYFDPSRERAGLPEDVAALVSEMSDTGTVVTLVNLNPTTARTRGGPGRSLCRAPDRIGGLERQSRAGRQAELQRHPESWRGRQTDAEDEALRERPDGEVPILRVRRRGAENTLRKESSRLCVKIRVTVWRDSRENR